MLKKFKLLRLWVSYKLSEIRNIYSHKAIGQQQTKDGATLIAYTILGKRDIYFIKLDDLMDNINLLERFHPCQTAKFGAIALGEVLFSIPHEQRHHRFISIKKSMMPSHNN